MEGGIDPSGILQKYQRQIRLLLGEVLMSATAVSPVLGGWLCVVPRRKCTLHPCVIALRSLYCTELLLVVCPGTLRHGVATFSAETLARLLLTATSSNSVMYFIFGASFVNHMKSDGRAIADAF